MIKFTYNLSNYKLVKVSSKIKRLIKINRQKLQDGIDIFQSELDWTEMWSIEDAQKRLKEGWWFYVIEKDDKYIGWAWFDTEIKRFCNLYVHKDYRDSGYGKELVYARLNECKKQNIEKVWMEVDDWNIPIQKIGQELGWTPKIHYTFWTGGYDTTFYVCKLLTEGELVQPIYIDDRIDHGGYHTNPLIVQRGEPDKYPRNSFDIEQERMEWLRKKIYKTIPNSEESFLETMFIDKPINEYPEISKTVEKYNEWIPETIHKTKNNESSWLEAQADIVLRFQKQFRLEIEYPIEYIEDDWYEIIDCAIEDGKFYSERLPKKYKDLKVFEGFSYPSRHLTREDMLEIAEKRGFDDLLYYTWTCWYPTDKGEPCDKCKICKERIIECRSIGDIT